MEFNKKTREQLVEELRKLQKEIDTLRNQVSQEENSRTEAEEECHVLFDGSLDVLIIIHSDTGEILRVNKATETILGYQDKALAGRQFSTLYSEEGQSNPHIPIKEVKMYDNVISDTFRCKDGTDCTMDMTVTMIPWDHDSAFLVTLRDVTQRVKVEKERERLMKELQEAMDKIKTLKGIVPICASCKKIRNDEGYWQQVEVYVHEHSEAEFSHGICPECMKKLYPEVCEDDE